MYKEKKLYIISMPRRHGKTDKAEKLAASLEIPIVTSKDEKLYKGFRSVIIDDLPETEVLDMINSNHPINRMKEVYYFRTFDKHPKNFFVAGINRTWDVTLECYIREQL